MPVTVTRSGGARFAPASRIGSARCAHNGGRRMEIGYTEATDREPSRARTCPRSGSTPHRCRPAVPAAAGRRPASAAAAQTAAPLGPAAGAVGRPAGRRRGGGLSCSWSPGRSTTPSRRLRLLRPLEPAGPVRHGALRQRRGHAHGAAGDRRRRRLPRRRRGHPIHGLHRGQHPPRGLPGPQGRRPGQRGQRRPGRRLPDRHHRRGAAGAVQRPDGHGEDPAAGQRRLDHAGARHLRPGCPGRDSLYSWTWDSDDGTGPAQASYQTDAVFCLGPIR